MRTMLKASFPVEAANKAIKDGSLPKIIGSTMDELRPESAYFYAENGKRTCVMVFDMKDVSQIPVIAEPFFMGLNADVQFTPVMNADDLKAGLERAVKKLG